MKCNQSRPEFELVLLCPFPTMITITSRAPPQNLGFVYQSHLNSTLSIGQHLTMQFSMTTATQIQLAAPNISGCSIKEEDLSVIKWEVFVSWWVKGVFDTLNTLMRINKCSDVYIIYIFSFSFVSFQWKRIPKCYWLYHQTWKSTIKPNWNWYTVCVWYANAVQHPRWYLIFIQLSIFLSFYYCLLDSMMLEEWFKVL